MKIKKILNILVVSLLFFSNVNAEDRKSELDNLFKKLKNSQNTQAIEIENKIWEIWEIHPSSDKQGLRLTELLIQGTRLMNMRELNNAYNIFTKIIKIEPKWAEAWNKRATVLYLMKQYESSLADIKITLVLEPRHFGAISGQALNYIGLNLYEQAIESYKAAQKIYPDIDGAKKMIPQLQKMIKDQAV